MVTVTDAIEHAARLLTMAENDPDPSRMERYEKIADSWVSMAHLLQERERV